MTYRPPPVTDEAAARRFEMAAKPKPKGAPYLAAAVLMHSLAIPIGLVLFKALVESVAGWGVSWGEIMNALIETGAMGIFLAGIFGQVFFAVIAGIGAFLLYNDRPVVAVPMIVVGAAAVAFSFIVFGGIIGAIGGILSTVGGVMAKGRPAPAFPALTFPRPYTRPPPPP